MFSLTQNLVSAFKLNPYFFFLLYLFCTNPLFSNTYLFEASIFHTSFTSQNHPKAIRYFMFHLFFQHNILLTVNAFAAMLDFIFHHLTLFFFLFLFELFFALLVVYGTLPECVVSYPNFVL